VYLTGTRPTNRPRETRRGASKKLRAKKDVRIRFEHILIDVSLGSRRGGAGGQETGATTRAAGQITPCPTPKIIFGSTDELRLIGYANQTAAGVDVATNPVCWQLVKVALFASVAHWYVHTRSSLLLS
jgi:hypothetical protein